MEGHAQKCVNRYYELARNTVDQLHHVWTITKKSQKRWKLWESCQRDLVSDCIVILYLARIGRPDLLGTFFFLARSVTKWNGACDVRLARLISYITHPTTDSIFTLGIKQPTENWYNPGRKSDRLKINFRWCSVSIFDRIRLWQFHGLVKKQAAVAE